MKHLPVSHGFPRSRTASQREPFWFIAACCLLVWAALIIWSTLMLLADERQSAAREREINEQIARRCHP